MVNLNYCCLFCRPSLLSSDIPSLFLLIMYIFLFIPVMQCPGFPIPRYSKMECKRKGNVLLEHDDISQVGTTCSFECLEGFKNTQDSNMIKCHKDKTWKGTFPKCKRKINSICISLA